MTDYPPTLFDGRPPAEPRAIAETSRSAASSMVESSKAIRADVLREIRTCGGLTDDELERVLHRRHQTVSARRRELVLLGLVKDSETRRKTSSGRSAVVWVAT